MDVNALTETPAALETPARPAPPGNALPAGTSAAIAAVLALVIAMVGLVVGGGDEDVATGQAVSVELTEFAIAPAAVQVPAGGLLRVTNEGSTAHNLTVRDTDVATAELAAGESEDLDVSSLEPGEYEILCSVPGHAESGMTGMLTVTEGSVGSAGGAGTTMAGTGGGHLSDADYQRMDEAMEETIAEFPADGMVTAVVVE